MTDFFTNLVDSVDKETVFALITTWGLRIVAALALFLIGWWVARLVSNSIRRTMVKADKDETVAGFVAQLAFAVLFIVVLIAALGQLGVQTASLIAVLGAAGLAVGLALQGSLSNFAAGIMLIVFRPFRAGDFVEAAGISGVVEEVRIFQTRLRTPDNREITVPNGKIYDDSITNYSARDTRRVDLVIGVSYDDDLRQARQIIEQVLGSESRVLEEPPPQILLLELADSSVNLGVRPWVATSDYWDARSDLLENIKRELETAGITIPFPQRDVHLHGNQGGEQGAVGATR